MACVGRKIRPAVNQVMLVNDFCSKEHDYKMFNKVCYKEIQPKHVYYVHFYFRKLMLTIEVTSSFAQSPKTRLGYHSKAYRNYNEHFFRVWELNTVVPPI